MYLIGFQNRLLVFIRWAISFVTRGRGARLINLPPEALEAAAGEVDQAPEHAPVLAQPVVLVLAGQPHAQAADRAAVSSEKARWTYMSFA